MEGRVSIIMPAYNSAAFIEASIASVLAQTYQDWELIIVDDCSKDATVEIVKKYTPDARIRLKVLAQNAGAGVARDTAVAMANGRYIAFLDSDDLWLPQKLEKQLRFMQAQEQPFTFSFYDCIDESGMPLNRRIEAPRILSYRELFFCNFVGNLTGIYDTDFYGKVAIASVRKRQDWILWLKLLQKIRSVKPVPESLAHYRVRKSSVSSSKWPLLKHNFVVYRDFHKMGTVGAAFCMIGFLFVQFVIKPRYVRPIVS